MQEQHFAKELKALKKSQSLHKSLHPFLDSDGLLRVGGREHNSKIAYSSQHPPSLSVAVIHWPDSSSVQSTLDCSMQVPCS